MNTRSNFGYDSVWYMAPSSTVPVVPASMPIYAYIYEDIYICMYMYIYVSIYMCTYKNLCTYMVKINTLIDRSIDMYIYKST